VPVAGTSKGVGTEGDTSLLARDGVLKEKKNLKAIRGIDSGRRLNAEKDAKAKSNRPAEGMCAAAATDA